MENIYLLGMYTQHENILGIIWYDALYFLSLLRICFIGLLIIQQWLFMLSGDEYSYTVRKESDIF